MTGGPTFNSPKQGRNCELEYVDTKLYQRGIERDGFPDVSNLNTGATVGVLVSLEGNAHIYVNAQHISWTPSGLPVDKPLWGRVTMIGGCVKMKSELLG